MRVLLRVLAPLLGLALAAAGVLLVLGVALVNRKIMERD